MSNDYVHLIGQLGNESRGEHGGKWQIHANKEGEKWSVQQMVVQYDSECKTKTWLDCKTELN